ncbi:MAG TPA: 3-oxoacyl-ACP synthase III [Desulfobacterales bacterium]
MLRYDNVIIDAFGYELPPNVFTSDDLEEQLEPLYRALRFQKGQLEALTGIRERRFWDPGFEVAHGAAAAGRKALRHAAVSADEIGILIYAAVCRDNIEPATACSVCHELGLRPETQVYDVSNACLGVLNGMVQIANAIELGQIRAGMVVACETSRQVVEATIRRLNDSRDMNFFKKNIATLTGGSGAVAVILSEASAARGRPRLLGGTYRQDNAHHRLCMWGAQTESADEGLHFIETDSMGILSNGVRLGAETFKALRPALQWSIGAPDRIVCHQVGETHQRQILEAIGISPQKDFTTFQYLGNIGSVSLPITAAIATERRFINPGDRVGFLGIGSGLNCLMLGLQW